MGECIPFPSEVNTDDAPLIPEGIYQLAYVYHSTFLFMGRQPKVAIFFRIVDPGDYFGIALTAYYNVIKFIGNRGKSGGFKVAKRSSLARDYCRVFPTEPTPRLDRLPLSKMSNVIIQGTVRTVEKDFNQREIPEAVRYSKILTIELYRL